MSDLTWGVPSQRKQKTEKFDTPVLTMSKLGGKGSGRKFSFNKAAQTALGVDSDLDQSVMIGFPKGEDNNGVFVKVVNGETNTSYKLTKSATFSNKKVFEFITKRKELSNDTENELHIEDNSKVPGAFEISMITNDSVDKEAEMYEDNSNEEPEVEEDTEKVSEEENDNVEDTVEEETTDNDPTSESKEETEEEETW